MNSWGAGAGGSIYIECLTLAGGGSISAEGGKAASNGGSGSGGRISVQYDPSVQATSAVPSIVLSANSLPTKVREYGHVQNSRVGTLCLPDNRLLANPLVHNGVWIATNPPGTMAFSSIEASDVWFQLANDGVVLTVTNELRVHGTGRLEFTNAAVSCGSLIITNFGICELYGGTTSSPSLAVQGNGTLADDSYLKVCSGPTNAGDTYGSLVDIGGTLEISDSAWVLPASHPVNGGSVKVLAGNVTIGTGSGFDSDGLGYHNIAGTTYGPGRGTTSWGGAGYGGAGSGLTGAGGTYGTSNAPVQCGSAGGGSATHGLGDGGGLIWLSVLDRLTLDGTLTASGLNGGQYGGGGSGGGIYVHAKRFGGSGVLWADGGNAGTDNRPGGGGGGRIHVARVKDVDNLVTTSVDPGHDSESPQVYFSATGTVVWTWLPPVDADIEMREATNVTSTSGCLNAHLVTTGASATVVSVYWGETDGETNAALWAQTNVLATATETGRVTETVTLVPGKEYYYRYAASNDAGFVWAEEDSEYLLSDGLTIAFAPTAVSEAGAVAAATVSRSSAVTSEAVTVYYTIGGTASNGNDYTTIDTNVTILAGDSNATVTLTTIPDAASPSDKTLILTLVAGKNYAVGAPSVATLTIENEGVAPTNTSVADGDWHDTATWSEGHVPVTPQAIIITNNVVLTADTEQLASLTVDGGTLTFSNWTTRLYASNVVLNAGTMTCAGPFNSYVNVIWPTLDPSNRVRIVCNDLFVAGGAAINVDGRGFRSGHYSSPDYYPGHGPGGDGRWKGATHAAVGGKGNSKAPYGDYLHPTAPGSGGGPEYTSSGGNPGHGGGAVEVVASGTVTVDGEISADGVTGTVNSWGAGSGGSICIACRRVAGSGTVTAEGGAAASNGGSGSGGRISVQYDPSVQATSSVPSLAFSALSRLTQARSYGHVQNSRIGTLCFPDDRLLTTPVPHSGVWVATNAPTSRAFASLEVSGVWLQLPEDGLVLTVTNGLDVQTDGRLEVTNAVVSCGSLAVTNFGIFEMYRASTPGTALTVQATCTLADDSYLKICAAPTNGTLAYGSLVSVGSELVINDNAWIIPDSHPENGGSLKFQVGKVTIGGGAGIDGSAAGYRHDGTSAYGPGAATGTWGGGGYGGVGGGANGGPTYGSSNAPVQCGSSGGGSANHLGGSGGSLIWLEASGTVTLDGTLNADGGNGGTYGSGGSGGGIYVTCPRFGGSGSLTADGGDGGTDDRTGGGGGGRICITRVSAVGEAVTTSVEGGSDSEVSGSKDGEPGTVVWTALPKAGTILLIR